MPRCFAAPAMNTRKSSTGWRRFHQRRSNSTANSPRSRWPREHAASEETQLFAAAADLDSAALGAELALRRGELLGEQGPD